MATMTEVPELAAAAVPADAYLLDVREPDEWQAGHIDGAVHIPMQQIPARLAELPTDVRIVVVCRIGGRSAAVTGHLRQAGLDAINLAGGMHAWAGAGRPMVSDTAAEPFVG